MKLLSHYYRTNIIATIIIVLLSSAGYYFIIHYVLIQQLDEALKVEELEVIDYIKENKRLPEPSAYQGQEVIFKRAPNNLYVRRFSTVKYFDKEEGETLASRQLLFSVVVNQEAWYVFVVKSQEETEDIIQIVLIVTLTLVVALLFILFLINRFALRRLWRPFESTLSHLKNFNLSDKNEWKHETSNVDEFNELNDAVDIMANRVLQEYDALKKFTDNASHEMQTPLAIINSRLDVLLQVDNITEYQMEQMQGIYNALDRLSKLNQSLLLLARIENNQFYKTEKISLDVALLQKIPLFENLIKSQELQVFTDLQPITIYINQYLLDVLLNNLIGNAIRYNLFQGAIKISITDKQLIISNTSALPPLDIQKVFQRFYRHEETVKTGNGLGLSIVQQICNDAGYRVNYFFTGGLHNFQIIF